MWEELVVGSRFRGRNRDAKHLRNARTVNIPIHQPYPSSTHLQRDRQVYTDRGLSYPALATCDSNDVLHLCQDRLTVLCGTDHCRHFHIHALDTIDRTDFGLAFRSQLFLNRTGRGGQLHLKLHLPARDIQFFNKSQSHDIFVQVRVYHRF